MENKTEDQKSKTEDQKSLEQLINRISLEYDNLVVHSLQFVAATYPEFDSQAWRTLSLDILPYQRAVNTFLAFNTDTKTYTRSLLRRDYDSSPYWYRKLGDEIPIAQDKLNYNYKEEPTSEFEYTDTDNQDINSLLEMWESCLKHEIKGGSTMWIPQPYVSRDGSRQLVSAVFLILSKPLPNNEIKYKVAKLCKDYIVNYIVHLYQNRLRDEIQVFDKRLLKIIDDITDSIFTGEYVRKLFGQFKHALNSRSPLLIMGEIGTGKLSIARQIYDLREKMKSEESKDEVSFRVEINLGLTPDDPNFFLSYLKMRVDEERERANKAQRRSPEVENKQCKVTIIFDDIHLAPIKIQRTIKELLDYSLDFSETPPSNEINFKIDRALFITVRGRGGDIPTNQFLEELWFRISLFPILVPSLRHRRDELEEIIKLMQKTFEKAFELRPVRNLEPKAIERLKTLDFSGNYRELFNILLKAQFAAPDTDPEIREEYLGVS